MNQEVLRERLGDIARSLGMPDDVDVTPLEYMQTYYPVTLKSIEALFSEHTAVVERNARSRTLNDITVWANNEMAKDHVALNSKEKEQNK